jgi:transcription elongation GreA/GreB family factor
MLTKPNIHAAFLEALNTQIDLLTTLLNDLKHSASNETKSTAGDKHETALAHLQIQQQQTLQQLQILELNKTKLLLINPEIQHTQIRLGSLIQTNQGCFYMSIALPSIVMHQTKIIAISPSAPLGSLFLGLQQGDQLQFNKTNYTIIQIS